eukprot:gnl/MRDRNA2_/MRDRNA2_100141_c0_seq1.p1 gnl/MRDRNA2_/MRDRNA2_100141_c0~~gnl/MRDRNA2_/MRDRNA2_100141_c0_seq1.p1  ORF type:complete len:750 (+),score=175.21 gnl/MRDRNA2_/MRDRNA2_100141_c0_seq1:57-2252(+)
MALKKTESIFCGFTGSLGYSSTEQAFSALGQCIGCRACRIPDGETGKRHKWITWQREVFEQSAQFEVSFSYTNRDGTHFEMFRPKVPPSSLEMSLGYAQFALESFATFRKFRDQGKIPSGIRFQVSLPTPTAILTVFVDREYRAAVAPALQRAMAQDVKEICANIPENELAIQWDVAVEVIGFEGGGVAPRYPLHIVPKGDIIEKTAEEIATLSNPIPEAIELGVHFCYGSANAKNSMRRAVQPQDLKVSVAFANRTLQHCKRHVNWLHMLSPEDRFDNAWFEPLADLADGPEILLGVIHLDDGVPGAVARTFAARKYLVSSRRLGIAAECGLGGLMEYGPEQMNAMLETHAAVVDCFHVITGRLSSIPAESRLRKCMERVVQVSHEVIKELKPTHEEWQSFLAFLRRTAACCTDTRNEFIMLLDFLGVRPLLDEIEAAAWPQDATPPSAVGPFRDKEVPKYPAHGGDLCLRQAPSGLACTYKFEAVSCGDRRALRGAEFEVWMADHEGVYSIRDPAAPKHNLYGEFLADDVGTISFRALKPRNYGVNTTGTGGALLRAWGKSPIRPGHVHVAVRAPGFETLVTSLYFDDDPYLWADPAWGVAKPLVVKAEKSAAGEYMANFTFVLRPSEAEPPAKRSKTLDESAQCSRNVTAEVLKSLQQCQEKRTKEVLEVIVRKLHSLAEELRPSFQEYGAMLQLLRSFRFAGEKEFDMLFEAHGCLALVNSLWQNGA